MNQRSPDQRTEAVSDARLAPSANRASLRKLAQEGKLLISQSPVSLEICKKATLEVKK